MARSISLAVLVWTLAPAASLAQAPTRPPGSPPPGSEPSAAGKPSAGAPQQASGGTQAPGAASGRTADEQVDLQVKTLEERVNDLKEKIFRTKARLMNLQEMVIGGDVTAGAKAILLHRNEMGGSFVLESVAYLLDGAPVYTKVDVDGDLEKREEFEIFNGRIVPGNHQIGVKLTYHGRGYGLFSYLEGYKFKVQSSYTFNAEPGKATTIKIVGFEKGGITAELKDRPSVRYDVDVKKEEVSRGKPPAPAGDSAK